VINIDKSGYVVIDSPIITLHRSATNVTLTKVDADGKTNEEDTKTLTLSTSALVDGLEPTDIKIVNKTDENRSLTADKILT
jgi:hypothetical protein